MPKLEQNRSPSRAKRPFLEAGGENSCGEQLPCVELEARLVVSDSVAEASFASAIS